MFKSSQSFIEMQTFYPSKKKNQHTSNIFKFKTDQITERKK